MIEKQFKKAVIVITILLVGLFIGLVTTSKADATTNQIIPQSKPLHFKLQDWAQSEWNDIKTYQAENWADGKAQLNRNKEQVSNLFQTLADGLSTLVKPNEDTNK
jgi:predicted PurR-regulated permease PerM